MTHHPSSPRTRVDHTNNQRTRPAEVEWNYQRLLRQASEAGRDVTNEQVLKWAEDEAEKQAREARKRRFLDRLSDRMRAAESMAEMREIADRERALQEYLDDIAERQGQRRVLRRPVTRQRARSTTQCAAPRRGLPRTRETRPGRRRRGASTATSERSPDGEPGEPPDAPSTQRGGAS